MLFGFTIPTEIRFGRGTSSGAAHAAVELSDRVLLVHGKSEERARWLINDLRLRHCSVETIACHGEPDLAAVDGAVAIAREMRPGVVVALGGGATVDMGKAVAALALSRDPTLAYLEIVGDGRELDAHPLPFIAIPTTAGTGSEVTKNAVIGVPAARTKVSLRDPRMTPNLAIVDPALTDGAPAKVTFSSGFDAISQVIEPYLSVKSSPLTDALCVDAIPRGLNAILRLAEKEDPCARDDMALTSLFGGIALANAGLGAIHGLAGVIGGHSGAAHGEVCARLLPHVLAFNAQAELESDLLRTKMDQVFEWIGRALDVSPQQATVALDQYLSDLGLRTVAELGVSTLDISAIASAARVANSSKTNPVPPEKTDFEAILKAALSSHPTHVQD